SPCKYTLSRNLFHDRLASRIKPVVTYPITEAVDCTDSTAVFAFRQPATSHKARLRRQRWFDQMCDLFDRRESLDTIFLAVYTGCLAVTLISWEPLDDGCVLETATNSTGWASSASNSREDDSCESPTLKAQKRPLSASDVNWVSRLGAQCR
ncbi:hypothetical protein BC567DRAFT_236813, partial [Phyllosticta citribraziliensis]